MNCKYCRASCTGAGRDRELAMCLGYDPPKNNADRIRSMTDEELATWIFTHRWNDCSSLLDWLKDEVSP